MRKLIAAVSAALMAAVIAVPLPSTEAHHGDWWSNGWFTNERTDVLPLFWSYDGSNDYGLGRFLCIGMLVRNTTRNVYLMNTELETNKGTDTDNAFPDIERGFHQVFGNYRVGKPTEPVTLTVAMGLRSHKEWTLPLLASYEAETCFG